MTITTEGLIPLNHQKNLINMITMTENLHRITIIIENHLLRETEDLLPGINIIIIMENHRHRLIGSKDLLLVINTIITLITIIEKHRLTIT